MRPAYPQQIAFSYVQASLLFDFIVERWGEGSIARMLAGYRDGKNTPEIIGTVLGIDLKSLAESYDTYFRHRFAGPLAAIRPPDDPDAAPTPFQDDLDTIKQRATNDPDDFLAQLAIGRALLNTDPDGARQHLERARDLFPQYAGGDSPYWWLAEIHRQAGRLERAAAELEALTTRNQAHYPALQALAEVRTELSDHRGAAQALAAAQYIYPYEEDHHRRLAEWYLVADRPADAVRERRAVLALEPFNRPEALYHLARAQIAAGERSAARGTVLEALEQAPSYEEALELLLELQTSPEEKP